MALKVAQSEYTLVANALLPLLQNYVNQNVPDLFNYRAEALAAMPAVAGALAKKAVDTIAGAAGVQRG